MTSTFDTDDLLALRLRALGHPVRLAILRGLARAEKCQCGEIVRGLPLAQSTVSQHLKVLKEAGLITGSIEGPRSCYCLDRAVVAELAAALGPLLAEWAQPAAALAKLPVDPNCTQTAPAPAPVAGKRISA
ncbi:MAG: transcriptional regulator, ArsR family [Xanthobacteraceae bacterium]|jgi:DNA-binding transcriptional ArsR family regulator|nr:transcriptional regulator, ArsR family [Xanthobacteraceae bacterium]